ncbi:MAG TPA: alkaline phosphatase family protein [Bryobacteraceae bacterium]|nr:alkaline phosphatase family protein [Bryobacteraceae bacterium]
MTLRRLAATVLLFAAGLGACRGHQSGANERQAIVIGVDGMDPAFIERHWDELPNLARLRAHGSFKRLATTAPPQSPTAWSTFITGLDPAEHGIFDFVERDPTTMEPFLSMAETQESRFAIPLGPWRIPLSSSRVTSLRRGKAFWQTLGEHGIPATIVHMPTNYPPVESGEALAGMGTPDLAGTQGTFQYFSDDPGETPQTVSGGVIERAQVANGHAVLHLAGPPNSLRRDRRAASADIIVDVDPSQPFARLSTGDAIDVVREGEWSGWLPVDFPLMPHLVSARGMVRVFAKQLHPRFEVYVSPVNIDPESPDLPVSYPRSLAARVSRETGRYSTLGIPEDTSALRQGVLDLPQFLSQSRLVLADEKKLFEYSLDRFHKGLLFFYFSSVDQNSHVLWGQHDHELADVYRAIDASIGEAMRKRPSAELMVMSDHGFTTFERSVDLNHWLLNEGLLALNKRPEQIDWARTQAYALGLNGLYLNIAGRERHGIVARGGESNALMETIRSGLLALIDPATGRAPIETVTIANTSGVNARIAPDLIVGYGAGYRGSWESGVGAVAADVFANNTDAWIADHCVNPADVPGVLFTSGAASADNPAIADLPVSILALFGIAPESGMHGHSVYSSAGAK